LYNQRTTQTGHALAQGPQSIATRRRIQGGIDAGAIIRDP